MSRAELLQLAIDPSHVGRSGDAIRRNGRQLSHTVDDLLDRGAIATGKLSVNLQPVDRGALAAIVAEDVRSLRSTRGLQSHAPGISPCLVMADKGRMKRVVWNLLANAVKFTDAGEIEVSVNAAQDYGEMIVRDTGRGIDADSLPPVFDRFRQIAPQASGRVGGLGLGLWLARQIVSLHGDLSPLRATDRVAGRPSRSSFPWFQRPLTARWLESLGRRALPLLRSGDTRGDSHEP
ncbi:HAMP domain-containing sensor histidine kinase [Paraburkholderia fungorum]|uniref:sensor histidine kinase n=1 Tax=Paraburkholderia TaxID=1822464 RepID=UPI0038BDE2D7